MIRLRRDSWKASWQEMQVSWPDMHGWNRRLVTGGLHGGISMACARSYEGMHGWDLHRRAHLYTG